MFVFREFQAFMAATLPMLVQVGLIYLILRFTFAVSNVVVRLSLLNSPKKAEEEAPDEGVPDSAGQLSETVEREAEAEGEASEQAALPEATTED